MLKKDLRLNYLKRRKELSEDALSTYSIKIANHLLKIPIWDAKYFHLFLPITSKKEVDTSFILSILQGKDKNVILPKITSKNTLENILLTDNTLLKINSWGVPEPVEGIEVNELKIDVVFLPLLAFDIKGNRVGYGKGFYDIFLNKCRPNVIKIGVSAFAAEEEITDVHQNDIALNYCVTPEKIYTFTKD